MSEVGIPVGPINTTEILEAHSRSRNGSWRIGIRAAEVIGIPIKLSDTPGVIGNAPPKFGTTTTKRCEAWDSRRTKSGSLKRRE
jgi:crotonobetainyl-CoA:carnitine CoA-transferase CaiB-like acyl-CoA transferase